MAAVMVGAAAKKEIIIIGNLTKELIRQQPILKEGEKVIQVFHLSLGNDDAEM